MRDRVVELLPLLLVGIILLAFQLTRADGSGLAFLPVATPTPLAVTAPPTPPTARRPLSVAGGTPVLERCLPSQPRFTGGMGVLRAALGSTMGDPLECERSIDAQGNTQQQTTTGLAYRRKQFNETIFTTGWEHWALRDDGRVVYWAGDAVEPPLDAVTVASH